MYRVVSQWQIWWSLTRTDRVYFLPKTTSAFRRLGSLRAHTTAAYKMAAPQFTPVPVGQLNTLGKGPPLPGWCCEAERGAC